MTHQVLRCSATAHVNEVSHSFTCQLHVYKWNEPYLPILLSHRAYTSFDGTASLQRHM